MATTRTRNDPYRYWVLTIPLQDWTPRLESEDVSWVFGQGEIGNSETAYEHWQFIAYFKKKVRRNQVKRIFGQSAHVEPTRSEFVESYVRKEDTRIPGSQFEFGKKSLKRNSDKDWDQIWEKAKIGDVEGIPADVRIKSYTTLRKIEKDFAKPIALERKVYVFWGATGLGKSRRAWNEAGLDAYPKGPTSIWWDGYQGQNNVIIDEFRGQIGISHLLRWFDRYPVIVENKGGATVLKATTIWVTSNLHPKNWFPDLDGPTYLALERRLEIVHFTRPWNPDLYN